MRLKRWHLAKSEPAKVTWLITSLANLGVEVFYPEVTLERRGKLKLEPLFPNYVFCRFDPAAVDWPAMQWAPGFNYFLGIAERPSHLPDNLVKDIQRRVGEANKRASKDSGISLGSKRREDNRDFTELDVVFSNNASPKQRCKRLLRVIGRVRPVDASKTGLTPIVPAL